MPIYEYECNKCNNSIEKLETITSDTKHICQKCGTIMERIISTTTFILKGTGWYVTDYKK